MPEMYMDVDAGLTEVPVNILPLIDDTDFKTRETGTAYNAAGMDLVWNFTTTNGTFTQTAVTPTTAGDYDWVNQGKAMYTIEIPASGGASINNDTEGFGWFTGFVTGVLPWRGPVIGFRAAALNNALIDGGDVLDVNLTEIGAVAQSATDLKDFADAGYDPGTNKVQGVVLVDTTTANSDMRGTDSAALASVATEARLAELDAANLPTDIAAIPTTAMRGTDSAALASVATEARLAELDAANLPADVDTILTRVPDTISLANIKSEVVTSLSDVNLDHVAGTSAAIPSIPTGTYIDQMMSDGTATFDRTTDSLQAIRDRGDAAWTTGGGGSITDILNVTPLIPEAIDLANTATWRLGFMLTNALDDLPSAAEITPGTISIDRKAIGGTSWSSIVSDAACSEIDGLIYYDEVFDTGTGYAEGDSIRVTFKSQKITVTANDYEIVGATGRIFYTFIRETERGTDSAALASVATEARLAELDAANLPTDIAAIPTTAMRGTDSALTDKTGFALTSAEHTSIADETLTRDWTSVTGEAARSLLNAARFLRNKWSITGSTLTVTEEDDSTPAWTAAVTEDAAADPVTGVDPA